jgi:hypothetical protein
MIEALKYICLVAKISFDEPVLNTCMKELLKGLASIREKLVAGNFLFLRDCGDIG